VGDHDDGTGIGAQQVLQPEDAVDIEVVGRLVEQQQLRLADQGLRQRHALASAAGKRVDMRLAIQCQARNRLLDPRVEAPAVASFKLRLQVVHMLQGRRVASADFQGRFVVIRQQAGDAAKPRGHGFIHGFMPGEFRLLRHIGDAQFRLPPQRAVVEAAERSQRLEQAGLAAAVAADQADALAGVDLQRGVVEQGHVAVGKAGVVEGDDGHGKGAENGERDYRRGDVGKTANDLPAYDRIRGSRPCSSVDRATAS
jgi:hypothetical protein